MPRHGPWPPPPPPMSIPWGLPPFSPTGSPFPPPGPPGPPPPGWRPPPGMPFPPGPPPLGWGSPTGGSSWSIHTSFELGSPDEHEGHGSPPPKRVSSQSQARRQPAKSFVEDVAPPSPRSTPHVVGGNHQSPPSYSSRPPSRSTTPRVPPHVDLPQPPAGHDDQQPPDLHVGDNAAAKPEASIGTQDHIDWTFTLPPGWDCTIQSSSKQPYSQGMCMQYEREGRTVRNMLLRSRGSLSADMLDNLNREPIISISQFEVPTSVTLKWYQSQLQTVKGSALVNPRYFAKQNRITMTESGDTTTYTINVYDRTNSTNPDQVTTVICKNMNESLNLENIQGDVLPGLPKALEYFYYFKISDVELFRIAFKEFVLPKINTCAQLVYNKPPSARDNPDYPFLGINVAFSSIGLKLFDLDPAEIGDEAFLRGQLADAQSLGDAGASRGDAWSPDWDPEYKANIHGIFLITAYNEPTAQRFIQQLETAFTYRPRRSCIKKIVSLHGHPRPGDQAINDPFGWRGGGFTNPQVKGVTFTDEVIYTGTPVIPMGVIVMGRDGDEDKDARPEWAKDGSLIATRKLNCLVPELDSYLASEGPKVFPNLSHEDAANKLGARLMGRWKNGTSVVMSPDHDAPEIARDDKRVNNFEFDQTDYKQQGCPFAAHMRKSNPRNDVPPSERLKHLIRRHNMPYGPEVTEEERSGGTIDDRGLHLCAYQSSIERGFRFIQRAWYNEADFPPNKSVIPGWDPLFGQPAEGESPRFMSGVNPAASQELTSFHEKFVDPRGGEYFFSPSMKTLRQYIAA